MKSPILSCAMVLTLSLAALSVVYAGSATWKLNPTSGDWNAEENWTPNTIPNGPNDIATFGASQTTEINQSASVDLNGMAFDPGASAYTISFTGFFEISGTGIVNNSGLTQNFTADVDRVFGDFGIIYFKGNATSGESVNYEVKGGPLNDYLGGQLWFYDQSSAGSGTFTVSGGLRSGATGSYIYFLDQSSAVGTTFIANSGALGAARGIISFGGESTATGATFISNGGAVGGPGGTISFYGNSVAESTVVVNGTTILGGTYGSFNYDAALPLVDVAVTANGGPGTESMFGGGASYLDGPSAQGCTFTSNGGSAPNTSGGYTGFSNTFDTGDSVLIANGGTNGGNGGLLVLLDSSVVGGRVELFGNGMLDISSHDAPGASVGSLEGDGIVTMGALNLTVGSNSLSTTFSGTLQGDAGSSLTKIGTGTLTLSGNNTYGRGTIISAGVLKVNNESGSGAGTGPVKVLAGTLGGTGIIAGAVTAGTGGGAGAFLEPSVGVVKPSSLSIQNALTFKADSTYTYNLNTRRVKADKVIANGVTIDSGAQFSFVAAANRALTAGNKFIAISNTAATPISGTFANLPDGSTFTVGPNTFQVSYEGCDGNDLTLTVVP